MTWQYDDGGRAAAGFKGKAGDCAARALAIAAGLSYVDACALVDEHAATERRSKRRRGKSSARTGVYGPTMRRLMRALGWRWTPAMGIGTGCRVHLRASELPPGRLIASCSRHYVAVVDGVPRDTYDPSRGGSRCVYGYWTAPRA